MENGSSVSEQSSGGTVALSGYLGQSGTVVRSLTPDCSLRSEDSVALIYRTSSLGGRPLSGAPAEWARQEM